MARSILRLLDHREVPVSDEARERIAGCRDLEHLDVWFTRAVNATAVEQLFVDG